MKVLVTGATGFIGTWLVKKLFSLGHEVHILARSNSDVSAIASCIHTKHSGDVTDLSSVQNACKDMHSVFHLAGLIAYDPRDRKMMEEVNIRGTAHVVEACLTENVKRLVYLSSVVAIGATVGPELQTEDSPFTLHELNLGYFETKLAAEKIVLDACRNHGLNAICLNPSTVYGPGDAKKGSRKTQVKVAKGTFKFFTKGGVSIVHISDLVDVIIKAWESPISGERFIVSGENITIEKLFEYIAAAAGVEPPKIGLPTPVIQVIGKVGDLMNKIGLKGPLTSENAHTSTMYHWFDSSKAKKTFQFHPRPAREAIEESVKWMKENGYV